VSVAVRLALLPVRDGRGGSDDVFFRAFSAQHLRGGRGGIGGCGTRRGGRDGRLFVVFERLEHFLRIDDVRHIQEAVAFEAEVDERGLHAGEHFRDAALVDIADDPTVPLAFDE
jgi:hypothetical protein